MSLKCENNQEIITNLKKLLNDENLQKNMINNQEKYINKSSAKDLISLIKKI